MINLKEYTLIHLWLRKNYGKANKCENIECKRKSKNYDWSKLKNKEYEKIRGNFWQLCKICHSKYDFTEETRRKQNLSHRGKITWNKGIKQWENKIHPRLGKKHSEETKQKIRDKRIAFYKNGGKHPCGMLGKSHTEEYKRKHSKKMKGRKFTEEHRKKISIALKGNKNGIKK